MRVRPVLTRTPVGWRLTQRLARLERVVRRLTPRLDVAQKASDAQKAR